MTHLTQSARILVTGGAGFIGTHLCQRLLELGHTVICLDNFSSSHRRGLLALEGHDRFKLLEQDVCQPLDVKTDLIYHLASPASPLRYQADPIITSKTIALGTINMLELAVKNKSRIFHASTSEIYGSPLSHPQTESYWGNVNPVGIRSCYDEAKRFAESLCFDYRRQHGLDVRVGRLFNTYGPGMLPDDGRVIPNLIKQALADDAITIYGDGSQTRSFCFISDTIEAIQTLMTVVAAPDTPVNIGNPSEVTIQQVAEMICKMTNTSSDFSYSALPEDDPPYRCPDISFARDTFNWKPKVSLQEGLAQTIQHFAMDTR